MPAWYKSALLGALVLLVAASGPQAAPIVYSVSCADSALRVEISLRGDSDGETLIMLPDHWAGSKELWRGISAFSAEGGAVSGVGATRTVRHAPGAPLVIRYRVSSGGGALDATSEKARPIVQPGWFFFHGEGVFAIPAGRDRAPVLFRWGAMPTGWKVASDLDHMSARAATLADISESVALGGPDVILLTRNLDGAPLRLAVRGKWAFDPADMADVIMKIVAAEHAFWRDRPQPFLVAMAPFPDIPGTISYTGTGRGDAFSILSTSGFDLTQATHTLAHEYMHHWVANLLGGLPEKDAGAEFWFSEGFDDYLTGRTLLASRQWSFADFFANKNEVLVRYAISPARAATGAEIARKFWSEENYERISYDRGHLLAILLDARIRAVSAGRLSLDDVLRAQRAAARPGAGTGAALFPRVLRRVTGLDMAAEIKRLTRDGHPFLLPPDAFGDCARVTNARRKAFTRGFDIEATQAAAMTIKGVDPAGPAYAAGMREGMRLVRRESGTIGDSTMEIAYRIADGEGERVFRYFPEGTSLFDVQQIVPAIGDARKEARCRILLGGRMGR